MAEARTGPAQRSRIVVRTTLDGKPAPGVSVQAHRTTSPDLRGPGEASAVTDDDGIATLHLPPGKYLLSARKRTTRASLGMVDEGGLFGFYPHSPLDLPGGSALSVEIPLFEKKGLLSGEEPAPKGGTASASLDGRATLDGKPAPGYLVFFYRPPDMIGRPVARSSPISGSGAFSVSLPGPGEYASYLRKSIPGLPGGAEEERIGPVRVRVEGGRFIPPVLSFR